MHVGTSVPTCCVMVTAGLQYQFETATGNGFLTGSLMNSGFNMHIARMLHEGGQDQVKKQCTFNVIGREYANHGM